MIFRLAADVLNDTAICLEIFAPIFRSYFTVIVCAAELTRVSFQFWFFRQFCPTSSLVVAEPVWRNGRVYDSGPRGPGFETRLCKLFGKEIKSALLGGPVRL